MPDTTAAYDLELRARDDDPATFDGRAVPYGETTTVAEGRELFARDAFDPAQAVGAPVYYGHNHRQGEMPIGVVTAAENRADGLYVTGRLSATTAGRDAGALLRDGALRGLSVGFTAQATRSTGRALVRTAAQLLELSLTPTPAYASAQVLAVREDTPMPDTAVETTETVADIEARDAIAELRTTVDTLTTRLTPAPAPMSPFAEFRGLGEYAQAVYTGDAPADLLMRAIVDQVTGDNPGVLPPSWAMDVKGIVNLGRPAVSAFGVESAGAAGMDFAWPYFDGDLSLLVAKQATQKTDVASVKVSLKKGTASLDTYAGGSDISYQLIQRSSPSYLAAYLRIMAAAYAVVTDKAFGAALVTAGTAQTGYDIATDTDGAKLAHELFKASVAIESATGSPAGFALVASDVFTAVGGMTKLVAPVYGTQNVPGVAQASTLAVNINGLRVIHDRNLAAGSILVSNEQAASWIEDGPRLADAEAPTKLGRDVAIYGYGVAAAYIPGGIIKIAKT